MKDEPVRLDEETPNYSAGREKQKRHDGNAKDFSPSPARISGFANRQGAKDLAQEKDQSNQESGDGNEEEADHAAKDSGLWEVFTPALVDEFRNVVTND